MTRILAVATALLAAPTLFAPAAQACISCEYVPEVVRGSQTSDEPAHYARERSYTVPYPRERSYTVEREPSPRPIKRIVRSESNARKVETAGPAPVEMQAHNEISSIAVEVPATSKIEPKAAQSESSSIAVASTEAAGIEKQPPVAPTGKQASAKPVGCKKYFPSVGLTLTVPCE
jgi:hypothetical protein